MRSPYGLAWLALPLIGTVLCSASPTIDPGEKIYANANEAFQDLLNALPEESLHAALNSLTKFKDGIFESHRHGVEHVHHDNPPLATKLIVAAVQDLKKRQQPPPTNGTSPSGSSTPTQTSGESIQPSIPPSSAPPESSDPAPTSDPAPPPSSDPAPPATSSPPGSPPAVIPVRVTTTDSNGQLTIISTDFLSQVTALVPVDKTLTDSTGALHTTRESKPAVIFTATDSAGSAFETATAVDFAPTPGQIFTNTDDRGSTFFTTYTPKPGRVSSILLVTTVGPDGRPAVVTRYTYVDPVPETQGGAQSTAPVSRTTPSLQTNAAVAAAGGWARGGVVGGVVGAVMLLV